jgi:D-beta-D-heptose 7-phosphate kinase/D-beta-D-heptose 1-phosphate adenosyltransferase
MTDAAVHGITQDTIARLGGARVAVIGDVMLDRYVYGAVDRVSPEAPIAVLGIERERSMPGGAGNVARNAAALGAEVSLVGFCGDDEAGVDVSGLLAGETGISSSLVVVPDRPTSVKTRYVAGNQQLLRTDKDAGGEAAAGPAAELLAAALAAVEQADAIILSDYAKGVLSRTLIDAVVAAATRRAVPVIVDPKSLDFGDYRGVGILTPNRAELQAATKMDVADNDQAAAAARHVIEHCGINAVLATRGGDGMSLVQADGATVHIPTSAREVFDVSGAGDTVVATLATALAAGMALAQAAGLANLAAGVVVGKVGTAVVHPVDLVTALQTSETTSAEAKIVDLDAALDQRQKWRGAGDQVVFTNGCFDLIHPGHVALLAQAKAAGQRLVVGLNSDASVGRLKGENRPVQNEASRALVLASFAAVDLVIVFSQDTPLELISALRPDILVKGADYSEAEVVGGDVVKSYGGKVVLADIVDGHSTTQTISRMAET